MALKLTIAIWTAALALVDGAAALGAMTKEEFFSQYEPAVEKLEQFYTHMTMECVVTRSALEVERPVVERQRLIVQTDGDKLRIESFVTDATGGESVRVSVTTATSAFGARREAEQEDFVLSTLSSEGVLNSRRLRSRHYYVFAPFCENGGVVLIDKYRAKNIRITSIEEEQRDGEDLVKVNYERDIKYNDKPATYTGYDLLSKSQCWALREFVAGGLRGVIEYDGVLDGVPLLKSAEYWREKDGRRVNVTRVEVTKIGSDVAPAEMFEIASVVRDVRQEQTSSSWLLLIAGGVLLIVVAIVLARLAAHRRSA